MIKKLLSLVALIILVSCGGGTDVAGNGVGSGGTGSYTSGPVSGMGSIIVNGIRYDVESASVSDDDETSGFGKADVTLGMLVEVQGTTVTAGTGGTSDSATATSVRVSSDFIGQVQSIAMSSGTITSFNMFNRTVQVDGKTVFSADISAGDFVAVYGLASESGYTATRVQKLSTTPPPPLLKASGIVRNLNTSSQTFDLGLANFNYGLAAGNNRVTGTLRNGALVRVWWNRLLGLSSPIYLSRVKVASTAVTTSTVARFKGLVGEQTDATHFVVNGVTVDASGLNLSGISVGPGARLFVKGQVVNGVLVATEIEEETQTVIDDRDIELHGRATSVTSSLFTVRGVTVSYNSSVLDGLGSVTENACVEVEGKSYNSLRQLVATRIKSDSGCP